MWLLIVLTALLAISIHWLLIRPYGYWKKNGIPGPSPIPLFGNIANSLLLRKTLGEVYTKFYNDYQNCRYFGIYKGRQAVIVLRDPELIKEVMVKNFSSFHDNEGFIDESVDPIVSRNPFFLKGNKWKIVRSQVTANITSGKIKSMFYLMKTVGNNLIAYLNNVSEYENGIETKELAAKYTTDVVAACAFGLEGRNFLEDDSEFRKMGRKMLSPGFWMAIKLQIIFFFPKLNNILRIKFISSEVDAWFRGILMETIRFRKENNIVRNDYLDMLIALKDKPGEYEFKDIDVIAQAMTFYADGFETSSIALSFTLFEIATNPHVQEKLQKEIDSILEKHERELTYDAIQEMDYLDMVLSEGLRKYPPGEVLSKQCTGPYKFPSVNYDGSGEEFETPLKMPVEIPIHALHNDPQYYPEPKKFDPERFTEENKNLRPKQSYLPFGDGPRQCLGFRFAVLQIKAAIVSIIYNFELKVNPKTQLPLKMDPRYIMPSAIGGLWLDYYKRKK